MVVCRPISAPAILAWMAMTCSPMFASTTGNGPACAEAQAAASSSAASPCRYRVCMVIVCLHPEDAELGVRDFGVERGRQAQAQHHAGVGRVDHAIVPQARGGVVRVALVFVLVLDRLFERGFFFYRPRAALA